MKKAIKSASYVCLFLLLEMGIVSLAYADDQQFEASLSGDQEVVFDGDVFVPGGTDTRARGRIKAKFDRAFTKVRVNLRINNLTGTFAAAHFHCGRPGQNGPVVFGLVSPGPLTFEGDRIRGNLTNADFNGADCVPVVGRPVNNIVALAFAMRDGLIYANVHSTVFGSGEIRGQMLGKGDDDDD